MLFGNFSINTALILVCSYLIGGFPSAFIAGKIKGIDIRKTGSTNVGGMNAYTSVGKVAGLLVIIVDMGKGALVAWLATKFSAHHSFVPLLAVLAAIIGHNWMIYIGFKGGKGFSTLVGALFFLSPLSALFLYLYFILAAVLLFKDIYVAEGAGMFFFAFFMWYREGSYYWCIFMLFVTIICSLKSLKLYKTYFTEERRKVSPIFKRVFKPFFKTG